MKNNKSINYYKKFIYRIEKKLTVQEHPKMKDFAKENLYLYIIHDNIDNNRFLYISSKHYEENMKIISQTFKIKKIPALFESIQLKKKVNQFGKIFFKVVNEKADINIIFDEIIKDKSKNGKFFRKYKIHTKKICLDNPNWYIEEIKKNPCNSYRKKTMKLLLEKNEYNEEIINHTISTLFNIERCENMLFNDHSIILDQGKTGKSSLIGYMGEKIDNVSVAGLYGSSDSKQGKFKGGLVTTTKKTIIIDEINELVEDKKGEKILSVLNSLLENGSYNYQKQFGQKINSSSQFMFLANISDTFNLPIFLNGCFGNVNTIGRRIGIITYSNQLLGYQKGNIRPEKINSFLEAMAIYLSNLMNEFLNDKKFIYKLHHHKYFQKLEKFYYGQLTVIEKEIEEPITRQFIKSHKESINRIFLRSLKLWIFRYVDQILNETKKINSHTIYEVLQETEKQIKQNIINIRNIKEHVTNYNINEKTEEINNITFEKLNKSQKNILNFININKKQIDIKGINIDELNERSIIKHVKRNIINHGIPKNLNNILSVYGCNISKINEKIKIRFINKKIFEEKTKGLFTNKKINVQKN